jgi:2-methylcitrate dehydratase PrpD
MYPIQGFLHDLRFDDLPREVRRQTMRCLADLIATAAAGSRTRLSRLIHEHARLHFFAPNDAPRARPLLGGELISPGGAALAGGMTIDAIDAHDGHRLTKGHVGCALLPALAAVLEATGRNCSGREFLALLAAGYEIGTRAGIALHATAADYHSSGAWNAVNCAALGAFLLGADSDQMEHAIGIAEYHGPRSQMMRVVDHPTMLKDGSGWGAMAGVSAAYLAMEGFTGAPALTVTGPAVRKVWADLGQRWLILDQYFKPYPCCRWAHPGIDGALAIRRRHAPDPDQIAAVEVHTFHQATRLSQGVPANTEQAQYGVSFPIAAALAHGTLDVPQVSDAGLSDPDVLGLSARISLLRDPEYDARFPAERWARVTVTLRDGSVLESGPHTALGDPDKPMSDAALDDKYAMLTQPAWGKEKSRRVKAAIEKLDSPDNSLAQLLHAIRA